IFEGHRSSFRGHAECKRQRVRAHAELRTGGNRPEATPHNGLPELSHSHYPNRTWNLPLLRRQAKVQLAVRWKRGQSRLLAPENPAPWPRATLPTPSSDKTGTPRAKADETTPAVGRHCPRYKLVGFIKSINYRTLPVVSARCSTDCLAPPGSTTTRVPTVTRL